MTQAFYRVVCICAVAAAGMVAVPDARAQNQELRPLIDRIERLQRDIDVLQRQIARPGGAPAASAAPAATGTPASNGALPSGFIGQAEGRFETIEGQLRDLTGRLEEVSYEMRQITSRLDKLVGDVDFRLSALERGAAGSAPGTAPASSSTAPAPSAGQPAIVPPGQPRLVLVPGGPPGQATPASPAAPAAPIALPQGSPEAQYEFAYAQLVQAQREQSDFGRAEQALSAFLAAHPTHTLAGNAQYWLGESYYVRKDYQNAALAFGEGVKKYPNGAKAPDNLLKLGMSLANLNRKNDACGTFKLLDQRFPQAQPAIKQTAGREKQRLGCT